MSDEKKRHGRFWSLRERTEALLRDGAWKADDQAARDIQALLHDLSTYQVELELQNEELLRSRHLLEASRDACRALFEHAPLGYFIFDRNGLVVDANLEGAGLLGVPQVLLIKKPFVAFVDGASQPAFLLHRMRVFDTDQPQRCRLRLLPREGGARQVELFSLAPNDADAASRRCLTVIVDITERLKAGERDRYLASIVESSRDAVVGVDLAGRIVSWNAGAEGLYGYTEGEILGRPVAELAPAGRREEIGRLMDALRDGRSVSHFETVRLRKDGSEVNVSLNVSPIRDAAGDIVGFSCIARDITARKRLRRELVLAKREAVVANRAKSEFLANMSHEIRNPINAILGLTRMVLSDEELSEKQAQRLSMVLESSESLLRIVGDILDYSKIEAGKLELEERPFEVRRLLESVLAEQRIVAEHKGLALTLVVDPAVPFRLTGDSQRLRQVLINLIGNALKFTDVGRVLVKVCLAPSEAGKEREPDRLALLFSVNDTGIGLSPEAKERIFGSFVQADSGLTKKYAGSGLGLAICRKLTRLMGGDIEVESELGRGATFRFTAVFRQGLGEILPPPGRHMAVEAEKPMPPLSILLAEDNRINQLFTVDLLASHGHDVKVAGNGAEALELLSRERFDLVLMDVQMPVMDGMAATKAIREHAAGLFDPDIPVVGLSAYAMKGDRERFMEAGMDDYLTKPIRFEDFFRIIRRVVLPRLGSRLSAQSAARAYDPSRGPAELGVAPPVFSRMATLFLSDCPKRLSQLEAALAAGDNRAVAEAAHSLSGSAGAMRAGAARDYASQIESAVHAGTMEKVPPLAHLLRLELDEVVRALQAYLAGNPPVSPPAP